METDVLLPARARLRVRQGTAADARALAPRLRVLDRAEILFLEGRDPEEALVSSVLASTECLALVVNGRVEALWGVSPVSLMRGYAAVWCMGSPVLNRMASSMIELGRISTKRWLTRYPVLRNVIWADYTQALRWARAVGFEVSEPLPVGIAGEAFCMVEMRAPCAT